MQAASSFSAQSAPQPQEKPTSKPWQRQDGEPVMWFNRFKRYRELGPKRSLQAAVEQEHSQITALKSTNEAPSPSKKRSKPVKNGHLAEVPQPKPQVPGSWKQASIKWNWVERARAYDTYQLDRAFDISMEHFIASDDTFYSLPMDRIAALQGMFKTMLEVYNKSRTHMTYDQECAFMARMQSMLRDIREEMKLMDTTFVQVAARKRLEHWQKNGEKIFAPKK